MVESSEASSVEVRRANPALQPLDDRKLRHVHHGQTGAMWTAVAVLMVGFIVGGVAMVIGPNWILFVIGCAICVVGIIAGVVLQALGFGIYEKDSKK